MGDCSHLFKGQLACQFEAHHHHAGNPEEQDVVARLQQGAWVKHLQVLGLEGRPQTQILSVDCNYVPFVSVERKSNLTSVFYLIRPAEDRKRENAR